MCDNDAMQTASTPPGRGNAAFRLQERWASPRLGMIPEILGKRTLLQPEGCVPVRGLAPAPGIPAFGWRRAISLAAALLLALVGGGQRLAAAEPSASLAFKAGTGGEFTFDTGIVRGKLRPKGKCLGLASVTHVASGVTLDRGDSGYGLLSHYRVFTTNKRYGGGAWDWSSTALLRDDGAVEVIWSPATNRPFDMKAVYRWVTPDTCEVETIVTARENITGFESFLASYFQNRFTNCLVYATALPARPGAPEFVATEKEAGPWQMFPRDEAAQPLIKDGRWKLEPNPVDWTLRFSLERPIAVRRDPASGVTVALLAPARDCFAIAAPFQAEGHYSLYFSLFGRDLKAGETARARVRLLVSDSFSGPRIIERQQAIPASKQEP
jgi:hypothetical protein